MWYKLATTSLQRERTAGRPTADSLVRARRRRFIRTLRRLAARSGVAMEQGWHDGATTQERIAVIKGLIARIQRFVRYDRHLKSDNWEITGNVACGGLIIVDIDPVIRLP